MSGPKVDVRSLLRSQIEKEGGDAYPVGRALIAADVAIAELIAAAREYRAADIASIGDTSHDSRIRMGLAAKALDASLSNITGAKA